MRRDRNDRKERVRLTHLRHNDMAVGQVVLVK